MWQSLHVFDVLSLFCSKRFSVIMMSMTSGNLLFASFGVSSSTVRFHPLGVLSIGMTLPVSILYANARSGPKQTHSLSLLCHGFDSHRRPSYLCMSRFDRHEFAFSIFGHKQTSTFVPHNRLSNRRVLCSGFRVPVTSVPSCCWMPCQHHCPARCRVDSKRDLSASSV